MIPKEIIYEREIQRLTTPRSAAVAGILFAFLFATSLILIRIAIPEDLSKETAWVERGANQFRLAIALMPFAGIAFLWFIGVVRDRLGKYEDQFFSTVFFGSSLLFIGMVFVAMAIGGGILTSVRQEVQGDVIVFGRATMLQISNIYALRMAGVLMISLATIWLRTNIMPRWLVILTYLLAGILLLVINLSLWITLILPGWVFIISVFILVMNYRRQTGNI